MKQVKPKIRGYVQTGYCGKHFSSNYVMSKTKAIGRAMSDLILTGKKSKFKLVYK